MGFQLLQPAARRLIRADGKEMDCIGTCGIKLQLGEVKHAVEVAVVRQLNGPLLPWHDCICLRILPSTLPQQICAVEHQPATKLTVSRRSRDQDEAQDEDDQEAGDLPGRSTAESSQPPVWIPRSPAATLSFRADCCRAARTSRKNEEDFPKVFDSSTLLEMSGGEIKIELQ